MFKEQVGLCSVNLGFSFFRFNPDHFADESVMKVFSSLGFSGTWECPELKKITETTVGKEGYHSHLLRTRCSL